MSHIQWSKDAAGPFTAIPKKDSDDLTSLNGLISVFKRQLGLKEDCQIFSKKGMSQVRIDTQEKYDQIRKNNPKIIKLIIKTSQISQPQSQQPEKLSNISISEVPNSDDFSSSNFDQSGLDLFSEKSRPNQSAKESQKVEEKTENSSQNLKPDTLGNKAHISRNGAQIRSKDRKEVPSANQGCACSSIENEEHVFVCYNKDKEYKAICSSCHKKGKYAISMCMNSKTFNQMRKILDQVLCFVVATKQGLINEKGELDKAEVNEEQIKQSCRNLQEHQNALDQQNRSITKQILDELKKKDPNSRIKDYDIMPILAHINIKDAEKRKQEAIQQLLREKRFP